MKKLILVLFVGFVNVFVMYGQVLISPQPVNNQFINYPPSELYYNGVPLVYNDLSATVNGSSACIYYSSTAGSAVEGSNYKASAQFQYSSNLTITGVGRFSISAQQNCSNTGNIITSSIIVKDQSFAFTSKPALNTYYNGNPLVFDLVTTSTSASLVTFQVYDQNSQARKQNPSKSSSRMDFSKEPVPVEQPKFLLSGSSLTINGLGSFLIRATQTEYDIFYDYYFNVVDYEVVNDDLTNSTPPSGVQVSSTSNYAELTWLTVAGASLYCVEIYADQAMETLVTSVCGIATSSYTFQKPSNQEGPIKKNVRAMLSNSLTYYYRVLAENSTSKTAWSSLSSITFDDPNENIIKDVITVPSSGLIFFQPFDNNSFDGGKSGDFGVSSSSTSFIDNTVSFAGLGSLNTTVSGLSLTGFTLSFRVKIDPNNLNLQVLAGLKNSITNNVIFGLETSNGQLSIYLYERYPESNNFYGSAFLIGNNTGDNRISMSWSQNGKILVYVNGVEKLSVNSSVTPAEIPNLVYFGGSPTSDFYSVNGQIDDVALFSRALTTEEAKNITYMPSSTSTFVKSESSFTLYPNPSKGSINVIAKSSSELNIYDLLGNIIIKNKLKEGENAISLDLEKGIYLVKINGSTQKLVVE